MTEPNEPGPPPGKARPEPSASGLHEDQIHPEDLAEIAGQLKLSTVVFEAAAQVNQLDLAQAIGDSELQLGQLETNMAPAAARRMRVARLPGKAAVRKLKLTKPHCKYRRDCLAALRVPIQRERLSKHDLTLDQAVKLRDALEERFGQEAAGMLIEALYAHVPPEAAPSVRVDPSMARIRFQWPSKLKVSKARAGFYLVILRGIQGKRFQLLLRL